MPSNHLILCRPLLLPPSIFPSIGIFSNESALRIRWPKYWSFCFSISPSKEYSGLISFRMDWLDLLAVQGTLKSLLQHHSSLKAILVLLSLQALKAGYLRQGLRGAGYNLVKEKFLTGGNNTVKTEGLVWILQHPRAQRSAVSDSWRPYRLQHARPPCPSLSPRVCPSPRPSAHNVSKSTVNLNK